MGRCPSVAAAGDWWDPNNEGLCVWAAYQPKGAASLAASYTDLSGNGNNAGVGVAPTWDAVNGWIFNGTTQYLTTTFVPAIDGSQAVFAQFSNAGIGSTKYIFGEQAGGLRMYISPAVSATPGLEAHHYIHGTAPVAVSGNVLSGNLAISGNQGYRDGIVDGVPMTIAGGAAVSLYIAVLHNYGGTYGFWPGNIQAFAIYDCTLTAPQVAAVAAAMAAL